MHYRLPRALDEADRALLPEARVTITAFSAWVDGARDHLKLEVGGGLEASGVLGEDELVVTYGRIAGAPPTALIAAVEAKIAARFGPIIPV